MDAADLHDRAAARLRATRQRYTAGRRALVGQLDELVGPATIQDLLDAGSDSASSSLYRNLAILEQCEVVHRVVTADDVTRWELHEDLTEHTTTWCVGSAVGLPTSVSATRSNVRW